MKRILAGIITVFLLVEGIAGANVLDKMKELKRDKVKSPAKAQGGGLDKDTIAAGLKEALTVGSQNAVRTVSQVNGYFANPAIKIPLPEKVRKAEKTLRKFGLDKQLDEFILTMNQAAEKAAPPAKDIFIGAIREMTISDAVGILRGGDTAATDYMRSRTYEKLYALFKPTVAKAVMETGVTRSYQQLVGKAKKSRLISDDSLDLDQHVTSKALIGLFHMLGEEEKNIRKDPVAQVTDLLKKVFGK